MNNTEFANAQQKNLSKNTKTQRKNFIRPTQTAYVNLSDSVLNIYKFLAVGLKSHSRQAPATRLPSKQNACSVSDLLTSQLLWDDRLDRRQTSEEDPPGGMPSSRAFWKR